MFFKKKPEVTEIQTIQTLTYITIAPNGVKCFLMLNDLFGGRYYLRTLLFLIKTFKKISYDVRVRSYRIRTS